MGLRNEMAKLHLPLGDLSLFLEKPELFKKLLSFSKSMEKGHLVEYWMAAETFRKLSLRGTVDNDKQRLMAKIIIETYFLPDSEGFLASLQTMTRHEAMKNFVDTQKEEKLPPTIFGRSQEEIKNEITSDIFPLFVDSGTYLHLVEEGKIQSI